MSAGAKRPRKPRPHRVRKARMSPGPTLPTTILTSRDACQFVYDASNARLGALIKTAGGGYAAWSSKSKTKVGEFATAAEAERAVHASYDKPKPARRPKPWEMRR